MLLYCDYGKWYWDIEEVQADFNQWLPAYKQQVQHCRHPHKAYFPVYLGLGIHLLVLWWSLSFTFTWYFRSKEVKFIRGNSREDTMGFGIFPSSWISCRDPRNRNIICSTDSLEKLPSSIPVPSVYNMKPSSTREILSLGTDRIQAKQTRSQERWNSFQRWSFFYSPCRKDFSLFPAHGWRRYKVLENSGNLRKAQ